MNAYHAYEPSTTPSVDGFGCLHRERLAGGGYSLVTCKLSDWQHVSDGHPFIDIRSIKNVGKRVEILVGLTFTEDDVRRMYTTPGHTITAVVHRQTADWLDARGFDVSRIAFINEPEGSGYIGNNSWNMLVQVSRKAGA